MPDLMVMLSHNTFAEIVGRLETRIQGMVENRHEYPMWPIHGDSPVDSFEESYHGQMRHVYYSCAIELVRTLRALKRL